MRITIESTPNRILEPRIEKYYRFVAQNYSIYARILHYRPSTLVLAEHTVVIPITMEVSRQSISSDSRAGGEDQDHFMLDLVKWRMNMPRLPGLMSCYLCFGYILSSTAENRPDKKF